MELRPGRVDHFGNVEAADDEIDDSPYQRGQRDRFWLPSAGLPEAAVSALPEWARHSAMEERAVRSSGHPNTPSATVKIAVACSM